MNNQNQIKSYNMWRWVLYWVFLTHDWWLRRENSSCLLIDSDSRPIGSPNFPASVTSSVLKSFNEKSEASREVKGFCLSDTAVLMNFISVYYIISKKQFEYHNRWKINIVRQSSYELHNIESSATVFYGHMTLCASLSGTWYRCANIWALEHKYGSFKKRFHFYNPVTF